MSEATPYTDLTDDDLRSFYAYAKANEAERDGSQSQWADYTMRVIDELTRRRAENEHLRKERDEERAANLKEAARSTLCIYCGEAFMPSDVGSIEEAYALAVQHDGECSDNPIRTERDAIRARVEELTRERDEAIADAARQACADRTMVDAFDSNADAENWMGWRTRPDEQGRVFDLTVQLVGGTTVLDKYAEMKAERDAHLHAGGPPERVLAVSRLRATAQGHPGSCFIRPFVARPAPDLDVAMDELAGAAGDVSADHGALPIHPALFKMRFLSILKKHFGGERGRELPKVYTRFVRYEVECDACGIVDSGIKTKADAADIERKHRQWHTNAIRAEEGKKES